MTATLEPIFGNGIALNSWAFAFFFAAAVLIYYVLPRRVRPYELVGASLVFFMLAGNGWQFLPYIIGAAALAYGCSMGIQHLRARRIDSPNQHSDGRGHLRGYCAALLALYIILVFGMFMLFRCSSFFFSTVKGIGELFTINVAGGKLNLVAPLGLGYWTLSSISYVTDVYRGVTPAEHNPFKLLLFMSFFPQMTCGPITHMNWVREQLFAGQRFSYKNLRFGVQRMLWGYFKKMVVADRVSLYITTVYQAPNDHPGFYLAVAILLFGIQIYCDFSGCIDIALGAAEVFGIKLPEDFKSPFFSKTFQDFWHHWHITLSLWMKEYIFYPVLKSKLLQSIRKSLKKHAGKAVSKKVPTYIAMLCTWFMVGFWHCGMWVGGSWKYILCAGIFPCIVMILGDLFDPLFQKISKALHFKTESGGFQLFRYLRTIFLVYASNWWIFNASSLHNAVQIFKALFSNFNPWILVDNSSLFKCGLTQQDFGLIFVCVALIFAVEIIHHNGYHIREWIAAQPIVLRWVIYYAGLFAVIIFGIYGPGFDASTFIYKG
ncbi:MAG: hypothetical protein LBL67_01650 [Coriobacteriales bacterium]|nr:hypothetical protein [Coriobacteriales bacterium]